MDWNAWQKMTPAERQAHVDLSDLRPELSGLEGWRVEATDSYGEVRRFYVGKSTGWKPIHLEVKTRRSMGGDACDRRGYTNVRPLYRR